MTKQTNRKRICLVMRAPLARYPSSIFQAELMAEAGHEVWILDTEDDGYQAVNLPSSVERRILARTDYSWRRKLPFLAPWRRKVFARRMAKELDDIKPHLVIVYEPPAMAVLGRLMQRKKLTARVVWHFHEYPEIGPDLGPGTRRDIEFARNHAVEQDLILFPDKYRAQAFKDEVGLKKDPIIVMNCPRRRAQVDEPVLKSLLDPEFADHSHILYMGSIGPGRGVDQAIRSMKFWPANTVLVLIGPCSNSYRHQLIQLAEEDGMAGRIVFIEPLAPDHLWSARSGADIALTVMVDEGSRSMFLRYGAGASNKRFEAMASAVAQVTNKGPGIDEVIVEPGAGLAIVPDSPQDLGRAVTWLVNNPEQRRKMAQVARHCHLDRFNYEAQFERAWIEIERMLGDPSKD